MASPNRQDNLNPPKFGCLPIRTTLNVFSILGIIFAPSSCIIDKSNTSGSISLLILTLNSCILYGALKYHDLSLNISVKILYFKLILCAVIFCVVPVILASFATSGYFDLNPLNTTHHIEVLVNKGTESEEFMESSDDEFIIKENSPNVVFGTIFGLTIEVIIALNLAFIYMELSMVKRFRKYATAWREGKIYEHIP